MQSDSILALSTAKKKPSGISDTILVRISDHGHGSLATRNVSAIVKNGFYKLATIEVLKNRYSRNLFQFAKNNTFQIDDCPNNNNHNT